MAKILILANNDVGLYKFRKELIHNLISLGNEVYISLPYGDFVDSLIKMGSNFIETNIDRRGINPLADLKLLLEYYKYIREIKPDLVITYTIKPNIYGGIICRLKGVSYAINITGLGTAFQTDGLLKKIVIFLYKLSCKKAKSVFFENVLNMQTFIKYNIIYKNQACLLNGAGVNLDEYSFKEYPNENGTIRFVFVGRVMREKGIDELFFAAKKIRQEYKNVFFDIVGPIEENYYNEIENLKKNKIINYYGFQSDVKPFIERSHCLLLPSYHEGMANTLLEAGAMGRPLITSDIHGCKEAVVDGVTGYLVTVSSSEDLYLKVKRFIELSYTNKIKMGFMSHNHIKKHFNKKQIIKTTLKALLINMSN